VQALLEAGADPNLPDNDGWAALMAASDKGSKTTVQALIEAGADVNLQDNHGTTALMEASREGKTTTVHALILAGADVNLQDEDGDTALMMASQCGGAAMVQALLEAGADRSLRNKVSRACLFHYGRKSLTLRRSQTENKTAAQLANKRKIKLLIDTYSKWHWVY
jgi:ankyrin repeat protein